jgi:hypothetical protein
MPTSITWFDVDQPGVTQTKLQLLADAGAATASTSQPSHSADSLPAAPSTATSDSADAAQLDSSTEQGTAARFPLLVDSWRAVAADLSKVSLSSCLGASGFNPSIPTVWLAEALLYYLTLDQVTTDCPAVQASSIGQLQGILASRPAHMLILSTLCQPALALPWLLRSSGSTDHP